MLTPAQIKSYSFQTIGRGIYNAQEVDEFIAEISSSYEQLYKESGELVKRVSLLAEKLTQYRKDEDLIQKTLLVAQRKADELENDAKIKSDIVLDSAEKRAKELTAKSKAQAEELVNDAKANAQSTLAQAESQANQVVEKANADAEELISKASIQAKEQVKSLDAEIKSKSLELSLIKDESSSFKDNLMALYKEHLDLIEKIPAFTEKIDEIEQVESLEFEDNDDNKSENIEEVEEIDEQAESDIQIIDIEDVEQIDEETQQEDMEIKLFSESGDEDDLDDDFENIETKVDEEAEDEENDENEIDEDEIDEDEIDEDEIDEGEIDEDEEIDLGFDIFKEQKAPSSGQNGFRVYLEKFINEEDEDNFDKGYSIKEQFGVFDEEAEVKENQDENKDDSNKDDDDSQSKFKGFFKK